MKTSIQILGVIAVAASLAHGEKTDQPDRAGRNGPPNPKSIIERLDTDGNGTVSLAEFKAGPRAQENPEGADKVFARIDADGNGEISVAEFAQHMGKMRQRRPDPKKILERLDKDGDGSVSLEEFKASPMAEKNPERAEKLFGRIDSDGNGELSIDELAKHQPKHRGKGEGRGDGPREGRKGKGKGGPGPNAE